jgi:hypothetical protein
VPVAILAEFDKSLGYIDLLLLREPTIGELHTLTAPALEQFPFFDRKSKQGESSVARKWESEILYEIGYWLPEMIFAAASHGGQIGDDALAAPKVSWSRKIFSMSE